MNKTKFTLTAAACALALICSQSVLAAPEPAVPPQGPAPAAQDQARPAPALPHLRIAGSSRAHNPEAAPGPQPAPAAQAQQPAPGPQQPGPGPQPQPAPAAAPAPAPQPGSAPEGAPAPAPQPGPAAAPAQVAAAPAPVPAAAPELLRVLPAGPQPGPAAGPLCADGWHAPNCPHFAAAAPSPELNLSQAPQGRHHLVGVRRDFRADFADRACGPYGWHGYYGYGPACPPRGFEQDFRAGPDFYRGPTGFRAQGPDFSYDQNQQFAPQQRPDRAGVPGSRYRARVAAALADERFQDLAAEIADLEDQYFVEQSVLQGMEQQTDVNIEELRAQAQYVVELRNSIDAKYDDLMQQYGKDRRAPEGKAPATPEQAPAAREEGRPDALPGLDRQELRRAMEQRQLQPKGPQPAQPGRQPQPPRHHRWQQGE